LKVSKKLSASAPPAWVAVNSTSFERNEVIALPNFESSKGKSSLRRVSVGALSITPLTGEEKPSASPATVLERGNTIQLENQYVTYTFDTTGLLINGFDKRCSRSFISKENARGNAFAMFSDTPMFWDAWDVEVYHLDARLPVPSGTCKVIECDPLRVTLEIQCNLSSTSTINQKVFFTSESAELVFDTQVNWNEVHKLLKVEFPLDVHASTATYDVPYGTVSRPTHMNTSWDVARFEVCGHKYADLSEWNFGVSLLSDVKYGFSCRGSLLSMSLLRAPKAPDGNCDIGKHHFRYGLLPHVGPLGVDTLQKAHGFCNPLELRYVLLFPNKNAKFRNYTFLTRI
jgi:alpha-mannosidase